MVASIDCSDGALAGRVLVMHNNSTHILVALSGCNTQIAADCGTLDEDVELLALLPYGEDDWEPAYKLALKLATAEALER